jgi:hypothetical protein
VAQSVCRHRLEACCSCGRRGDVDDCAAQRLLQAHTVEQFGQALRVRAKLRTLKGDVRRRPRGWIGLLKLSRQNCGRSASAPLLAKPNARALRGTWKANHSRAPSHLPPTQLPALRPRPHRCCNSLQAATLQRRRASVSLSMAALDNHAMTSHSIIRPTSSHVIMTTTNHILK